MLQTLWRLTELGLDKVGCRGVVQLGGPDPWYVPCGLPSNLFFQENYFHCKNEFYIIENVCHGWKPKGLT